jgi:hypothetical protein
MVFGGLERQKPGLSVVVLKSWSCAEVENLPATTPQVLNRWDPNLAISSYSFAGAEIYFQKLF